MFRCMLAVCLAGVVVGCKKSESTTSGSRSSATSAVEEAAGKVTVDGLESVYRDGKVSEYEGKRVLCKMSGPLAYPDTVSGGERVVLYQSRDGFEQPSAIVRLRSSSVSVRKEQFDDVVVNAILRGRVKYASSSWSAGYGRLSPRFGESEGRYILLEDGVVVTR